MRLNLSALALSTVLAVGFSSSALLAQDQNQTGATTTQAPNAAMGHHHAANPQRQAKRMAKKLNLSPDQQSKLEPILADRDQQMQAVRADASMSAPDRHAKVKSIRQDTNGKIEAVLNDQQKQQYEQMKQNRREKKQGSGVTS